MTLGEKIQKLRKSCGLSQLQLAEQLDVSRQSVSKWELNESVPDINKIVRLSELFSVSVDELLKEQYTSYVENVDTKSTIEDTVYVVHGDEEIHREESYPPQRLYIQREKWRSIPGGDIPKRISVSLHQESDSRWRIYFQNP